MHMVISLVKYFFPDLVRSCDFLALDKENIVVQISHKIIYYQQLFQMFFHLESLYF